MYVLVIHSSNREVARLYDFLEPRGYVVDAAIDARNGLRFATEKEYDAILLQHELPSVDGIEFCRRLRDEGLQLPILILSKGAPLSVRLDAYASGADDFILKPMALEELDARIQVLVRRGRGEVRRDLIRVADLVYNPDTLEIVRAGRSLTLPRIPMRIFDILMRQSPRVVSRREIERRVWGNERPDSDALRAHLHVLRSTIDRPFDRPLLRTIHGVGYQIHDPAVTLRDSLAASSTAGKGA